MSVVIVIVETSITMMMKLTIEKIENSDNNNCKKSYKRNTSGVKTNIGLLMSRIKVIMRVTTNTEISIVVTSLVIMLEIWVMMLSISMVKMSVVTLKILSTMNKNKIMKIVVEFYQ